jgi:hypothetical protein
MHLLMQLTESATLLDALAIVSSLLILLFLMRNRRLYGSLVIDGNHCKNMAGFSDEVSLQMMSQQSIMAYANLKRSLTQEFESLWMLGDSASLPGATTNHDVDASGRRDPSTVQKTSLQRCQRYRQAEKMLADGADAIQIAQQCGIGEGEMALLQGLQELAKGRRKGKALV